jgi:hypothetical protein
MNRHQFPKASLRRQTRSLQRSGRVSRRMLGILGGFVLGWGMLATFREPEVFGQRPMAPAGSDLQSHVTAVNERLQVLTVVDSATRQICVYHIDPAAGTLTFKSARNATYDLQLREFNTPNPLPSEIQKLLEQR